LQDLGDLLGGTDYSNAYGINSGGQVVGQSIAATGERAFLWSSSSGMLNLNDYLDASGSGWTLGSATAINDAGQIVGKGTHNGITHAYLLTPVPEPGSLAMLGGLGLTAFWYVWRRRG
jgi:probable HAF family extracellular repeat protein